MAERDLALDCRGGPWPLVPVLIRCPKCGGALDEVHNLTEEQMVEVLQVGPHAVAVERDETGRWTSARSWATWPNPAEPDSLTSTPGAGWGAAPPLLIDGFEETITPLADDIRMHGETPERARQRNRAARSRPAPAPPKSPWWRRIWRRR